MTHVPPDRRHTRWLKAFEVLLSWVALVGGVLVFAWLAAWVQSRTEIPFDQPILQWTAQVRTEGLTTVMSAITFLGNGSVLTVVALVGSTFLWLKKHRHSAAFLAITAGGIGALNFALKALFARARPGLAIDIASGFSFPSGHAMGSASVYGALVMIVITRFPKLRWPLVAVCTALVVAIGVSRVYLHVHYPSDVLAGWGLGVSWPLLFKRFVIGPGFSPETTPAAELKADGVEPEEVRHQTR